MPINDDEILWRYSGGAGNSSPDASLGGEPSTTSVPQTISNGVATNILHNIFNLETSDTAIKDDYRIIYLRNGNSTIPITNGTLYFKTPSPQVVVVDTLRTPNVDVPVVEDYPYEYQPGDNTTPGNISIAIGQANINAATLADRFTAPTGITFSQPILNGEEFDGTALTVPTLTPGSHVAIYLKRSIAANAVAKNIATASIQLRFANSE